MPRTDSAAARFDSIVLTSIFVRARASGSVLCCLEFRVQMVRAVSMVFRNEN